MSDTPRHPAGSPIEGTRYSLPDFETYPDLSPWNYDFWARQHGIAEALGTSQYSVLAAMATALPNVSLSASRIARLAGVSERTVRRMLPRLRRVGAIDYAGNNPGGFQATHRYSMADIRVAEVAEAIVKAAQPCHINPDTVSPLTERQGAPDTVAGHALTATSESPDTGSGETLKGNTQRKHSTKHNRSPSAPRPSLGGSPVAVGFGVSSQPLPAGGRSGESSDQPQPSPQSQPQPHAKAKGAGRKKGKRSRPTAPPEALQSAGHYWLWLHRGQAGLDAWATGGQAAVDAVPAQWDNDAQGQPIIATSQQLGLVMAGHLANIRAASGLTDMVSHDIPRLQRVGKVMEAHYGSLAKAAKRVGIIASRWSEIRAALAWKTILKLDESLYQDSHVIAAVDQLAANQPIQTVGPAGPGNRNPNIGDNHVQSTGRYANDPCW